MPEGAAGAPQTGPPKVPGSGGGGATSTGGSGASRDAGLRRRFKTLAGGESSFWLSKVAPVMLMLTSSAVFLSMAKGGLRHEGLTKLSMGAELSMSGELSMGGEPSMGSEPHMGGGQTGATGQPKALGTVADQQAGPPPAQPEQQADGTAASQHDGDAGAGKKKFATVADELEATWHSRADGPETEGLPCRESDYCSVGKLRAYVGEIDSFEDFKKALNASCYKKECFHITIGSNGQLIAMNFVSRAWQLGLANVMLHATNNESCAVLTRAGYTNVTCVWTNRDWLGNAPGNKHIVGEVLAQWAIRYILFARAVWLGYNVFMCDSDSYLYRDPYPYLKRPPFANISFLSLQDGGTQINGGASYIHNARPGGPAWWTIAAAAERAIFFKENYHDWFMEALNLTDPAALGPLMMDQPVVSDIVAWQYLGFPTLKHSQSDNPIVDSGRVASLLDYSPKFRVTYPPEWKPVAGTTQELLTAHNLTIPFQNGSWPAFGAGPRFPPRGNLSNAFIKTLEEESGYKFHDAYGSPPPGFVMPPNETWAYTPPWLLSSWLQRGINGWWELGPPPPQVMIHLIYIPGGHTLGKENTLKAYNAWSYEASEGLEGRLFPSSTPEQRLPRVLALPPGMRLEASSAEDYRDKTAQLVKLALRLGRVLYMPEPICRNESWISRPQYIEEKADVVDPATGKTHKRFISNIGWLLSYGLDDDYHCIWWAYLEKSCMRAYLVHPDFKELVKRLPAGTADPTPDNTVQLEAGATLQKAVEAAAQKEAPHILFLSGMPDLATPLPDGEGEADKRFKEWSQECPWMKEVPKLPQRRRRLGELTGGQRDGSLLPGWADLA